MPIWAGLTAGQAGNPKSIKHGGTFCLTSGRRKPLTMEPDVNWEHGHSRTTKVGEIYSWQTREAESEKGKNKGKNTKQIRNFKKKSLY